MSSKARGLADLGNAFDDGALSNRNLIINGAMQVSQRGDRAAGGFTGSFYAGPDRWLVNRVGTGTTSFSQVSSTDFGGTKAAQATFLAAAGEAFVVTQRIEAANIAHLAGQTVTLSFWASGSSDAGSATLNAELSYAGAVDNFTTETTISSNSFSYSGTAAHYTYTFTLPAGAANGVGVKLNGTKTDATGTFTLTFGGVQLEVGDTATPFEHEPVSVTLQKAQRYYYRRTAAGSNGSYYRYVTGFYTSTSSCEGVLEMPVEMRATPSASSAGTFAAWDAANVRNATTVELGSDGSSKQTINLSVSGISGGTVHRPAEILSSNNSSSYLELSAEL